jgi:hypothetical protein
MVHPRRNAVNTRRRAILLLFKSDAVAIALFNAFLAREGLTC